MNVNDIQLLFRQYFYSKKCSAITGDTFYNKTTEKISYLFIWFLKKPSHVRYVLKLAVPHPFFSFFSFQFLLLRLRVIFGLTGLLKLVRQPQSA